MDALETNLPPELERMIKDLSHVALESDGVSLAPDDSLQKGIEALESILLQLKKAPETVKGMILFAVSSFEGDRSGTHETACVIGTPPAIAMAHLRLHDVGHQAVETMWPHLVAIQVAREQHAKNLASAEG